VEGTPPKETPAPRLRGLPRQEALGAVYPVATTRRARLLGLSFLDLDAAGAGLLIPGCRSVHTIWMRFPLDVYFLGPYGEPIRVRYAVPRFRVVRHREARSVLEVPAQWGAPARASLGDLR
jgi:uncharacterized membrane protein (UPF0127 family)